MADPPPAFEPPHATGVRVHASAEVEAGATLGAGTVVWRFVHVRAGARIGERCSLGQGCFVADGVVIGSGCRIQNNVSLYRGVTLDDDVFVGPSVVFTNVKRPRAAHPTPPDAFAPTHVGRGASIGANATIVCGVTIGEGAMVGAGSVVTHDVPPYFLVFGAPARAFGGVCACGGKLAKRKGVLGCAACKTAYEPAPSGGLRRIASTS